MRLLLRPATGYTAPQAASAINGNLAAIPSVVQSYLRSALVAYPDLSVIFTSSTPASPAVPLPAISAVGLAPTSRGSSGDAAATAPMPVAGIVIGAIFAIFVLSVISALIMVRLTGSCCGVEAFCVPFATCFGACPLPRVRKPFSSHAGSDARRAPGAAAPPQVPPPGGSTDGSANVQITNPMLPNLKVLT